MWCDVMWCDVMWCDVMCLVVYGNSLSLFLHCLAQTWATCQCYLFPASLILAYNRISSRHAPCPSSTLPLYQVGNGTFHAYTQAKRDILTVLQEFPGLPLHQRNWGVWWYGCFYMHMVLSLLWWWLAHPCTSNQINLSGCSVIDFFWDVAHSFIIVSST